MHLKITGEYVTDAARTLLYQQNDNFEVRTI